MAAATVCPTRFLGSTGLKVSTICLGTMTFGVTEGCRPGQQDENAAHAILDKFVELGGNFIDTADVYSSGESEKIVGSWLQKRPGMREKIVLATKVGAGPLAPNDPNSVGLSRYHIMTGVEQSLSRLCTTHIDLYQMHVWDDGTPVEETLAALGDLIKAGKVRYIGVSNLTGWQFQKMVEVGRRLGVPIVSDQAQYNLLCRSTEWELLDVCQKEGVAMLPWSPLKGGLLSGKFKRGEKVDSQSSRVGWVTSGSGKSNQSHPSLSAYADKESFWKLLETLANVAEATNSSCAQVAIAWLLSRPAVSSVVVGATSLEQLQDNMKAAHLILPPEKVSMLTEASEEPLPYPYELVFRLNVGRKRQ